MSSGDASNGRRMGRRPSRTADSPIPPGPEARSSRAPAPSRSQPGRGTAIPNPPSSSSNLPARPYGYKAPPWVKIPVPQDPYDQHRIFYDVLNHSVVQRRGNWVTQSHAMVLRQVFQTIWQSKEWADCFGLFGNELDEEGEGEKIIGSKNVSDWIKLDDHGIEHSWSLSDYQKRMGIRPSTMELGRACGKVLQRFDRTYTCKTCAVDGSCVLCVECYQASQHEGHEVIFGQSFSFAAACDCGDPAAWKKGKNVGCSHHPPLPEGTTPPSYPSGYTTSNRAIPPALIKALYDTIVIILEFSMDILEHSLLMSEHSKLPRDHEELYNGNYPGGTSAEADRVTTASGPWSVVYWASEKHLMKEVTRQIRDTLGVSWEQAEHLAREAEQVGRKIMISTNNPVTAFHTASMFQQIDLGVILRLSFDVFQEESVGVMLGWLADMSASVIGGDENLFRRLLWTALNEKRLNRPGGQGTRLASDLLELSLNPNETKRIDWMMLLDARLWKQAKFNMRQIYANIYSLDWDVKKGLACRFAFNYVRMLEHYMFHEKDSDMNLIFCMTYMVFGNGDACAYAAEHSELLTKVIQVAQSWYTNQMVSTMQIPVPPQNIQGLRVTPESLAFKHKRGITIFSHARVLFRHKAIQRLMIDQPQYFTHAVELLNMFVGLQPQRRETGEHVEYEVEWTRPFSLLGEIAKASRELGEAFKFATPQRLLTSLADVATRIMDDIMLSSSTLDVDKYQRPNTHQVRNVLAPGSDFTCIEGNMLQTKAFSFHHYLNLLYAEMFKRIKDVIPFDEEGRYDGSNLTDLVDDVILGGPGETRAEWYKLLLMEWPLQKHVVLAQIRSEMWKKNGLAMRGQSHHYRELGVREATLDQEFFMLQIGLCTMDPSLYIVAMIDRFGLAPWFSLPVNSAQAWNEAEADPVQIIKLLEEFAMLIIYLITDTAVMNGRDQDWMTRKHIVQQLALNHLTYAELIKKLPERCTDGTSIMPILETVADFKQPTETANGHYTLKDECYDEVDVFWRHYAKNDQRTATVKLTQRIRRPEDTEDPLLLPRQLDLPPRSAPFGNLREILEARFIGDLVYWLMAHCMSMASDSSWPGLDANKLEAPQFETLLDLTLHLCLLALQINPSGFAEESVEIIPESKSMSTFQNLWMMQTTEGFKSFRPKIDYILDAIVSQLPEKITVDYRAARDKEKAKSEDPGKAKAQAAARQRAIMAEFAKKQADFATSKFMDEDDEDEDESMVEEAKVEEESYGQCIVCQDEVTTSQPGGMLVLLQPSRILRDVVPDRDWFEESLAAPDCLDRETRYHRYGLGTTGEPTSTDAYPNQHNRFGVYMSACNHVLHEMCYMTYFDATRWRHTQQVARHHPENAVRMEYLCPLCKTLSNTLIPLDKTRTVLKQATLKAGRLPTLSEKIRSVSEEGLMRVSDSARIWDHHVETGELAPWFTDCSFHDHTLDPTHRKTVLKSISRMDERTRSLLRQLSEQSSKMRGKKQAMYIPDDVIAYTISTMEIAQRGMANDKKGLSVAEQMPEINLKLITKLLGWLQLEMDAFFGPTWDRTALRVGLFARFLPDWYRASTLPSPLLLRNPLGMVIECAAIAPDLLQPIIIMSYYAELVRAMLGLSVFVKRAYSHRSAAQPRTIPPQEPEHEDAMTVFANFKGIMYSVLRNAGPFQDTEGVLSLLTEPVLAKLLYAHTLPFLRRAAIVYYASQGRYPEIDQAAIDATAGQCEYKRLLALLAIPAPKVTLSNPQSPETPIVARWLSQWALQGRVVPNLEFPGVYELYRLPKLWETMVLAYVDKKCDKCGTKPTFPAVCLYCGMLLCLGGDCCAEGEQGECNLHLRECGATLGMFVDIKRWVLLYLYAGSGSFSNMPYLDAHGELDVSMRRGYRQHLHDGRWDELRRTLWLAHGIPHFTARRLEMTSDHGGWGCL